MTSLMYHLSPFKNEGLILKEGLKASPGSKREGRKRKAVYLVEEHSFGLDVAFELLTERRVSVFSVDTRHLKLIADPECLVKGFDPCSFLTPSDVAPSSVKLIGHYTRMRWKSFVYKSCKGRGGCNVR